jgi:lipopolysaccharide/colanic/teichoic acid biosynthesis glycosyltransferase
MFYKKFVKRFLDIIIALAALIILSPLLVPVMLILWATGEHYVFYGQNRIGHKNKTFKIWKFATMLKASPSLGTGSITLRHDPRVLPFGHFLRKTKINELPQIFNILLGDMTLVGPRPLMKVDFEKYSDDIQKVIYSTRPGLTGIASIVFSDEEQYYTADIGDPHEYDRKYIAPYKGALEKWYQQHCSAATDLKIVFLTAWVIAFPKSRLTYTLFANLPLKPVHL